MAPWILGRVSSSFWNLSLWFRFGRVCRFWFYLCLFSFESFEGQSGDGCCLIILVSLRVSGIFFLFQPFHGASHHWFFYLSFSYLYFISLVTWCSLIHCQTIWKFVSIPSAHEFTFTLSHFLFPICHILIADAFFGQAKITDVAQWHVGEFLSWFLRFLVCSRDTFLASAFFAFKTNHRTIIGIRNTFLPSFGCWRSVMI